MHLQNKDHFIHFFLHSPVKDQVLVNDRWGQDAMCKHGDVKTCADRYQPGLLFVTAFLYRKGEGGGGSRSYEFCGLITNQAC